ncbi:unnamed protein product [Diplocarpon coronariae]
MEGNTASNDGASPWPNLYRSDNTLRAHYLAFAKSELRCSAGGGKATSKAEGGRKFGL